jgi:peroxiredoxin
MKDKFNMVGKPIGDFDLPNTRESKTAISSFRGKNNVVVVLLRSKY